MQQINTSRDLEVVSLLSGANNSVYADPTATQLLPVPCGENWKRASFNFRIGIVLPKGALAVVAGTVLANSSCSRLFDNLLTEI